MGINYDDFTKRLKEERTKYQLSCRGISENVQMSYSYYFKGEAGYNRFSYDELQNICRTDFNVFYVFTGKRGICANTYEDILYNAEIDHILYYLLMIHFFAGQKAKAGTTMKEWESIYSETEYLTYVYAGVLKEKNIFKAVRKYHDIKQVEMANILGMDVKTLRNLETNKTLPDSEIIFKMYGLYGVSPSVFLKNRKCFQDELRYLLNSHTGEVGDTLLIFIKTLVALTY